MKSKEIFPENLRLTKVQINELEGFKPQKNNNVFHSLSTHFIYTNKDNLLLLYSKALEEAEKEINKLEKELELYDLP